jgi:thiamine-monophosphate kinase
MVGEEVPLSGELRVLAEESCTDPLQWALAGGEDYELIFTAPPGGFEAALAALTSRDIPAARIGTIKPVERGRKLIARDGSEIDLEGLGYDHFL